MNNTFNEPPRRTAVVQEAAGLPRRLDDGVRREGVVEGPDEHVRDGRLPAALHAVVEEHVVAHRAHLGPVLATQSHAKVRASVLSVLMCILARFR